RYQAGGSTEHSYRGDLQVLLAELVRGIKVTNEPQRQEFGAPDYVIKSQDIPIGYIEAKDIGIDLNKAEKSEQMKRYLNSLDNLILTDYLEFRFYRYGEKVKEIKIGSATGKFISYSETYNLFIDYIRNFCDFQGEIIKSAEKLAKLMAQKARIMEEVILKALQTDHHDKSINDQYVAFKEILIHDLDEVTFADIYAQTITYGMFAARLHDPDLETFSRFEAAQLIPKSNPFLRKLFQYIAGNDLDDRIQWIVEALSDIFRLTDLAALIKNMGDVTKQNDPMIHFYETFLAEYDPKLRKKRGVWYTPEPVVNFIVRAVDDILKTEFNLPEGLADNSKTEIKVDIQGKQEKLEVHKVQILDPAAGTGTFLAEVVKHIYSKYKSQQGIWNDYVENHLIPRLNGFELLMAPYAMAHLKLDLLLSETGYKPTRDQRLKIFLTNALEEHHPDTGTIFASWLS
ncbi:MAG: N-6 DNA methylase, partial [Dethiobacteria bacterium]|nr:N-6 DNA methylase [Dethiobacteria bacterium]